MVALKLTRIGNSTGVVLPKEALTQMNVGAGDTVFLTRSADGGYRITPYDAQFERQMASARKVMKKRRAALRELAK
jgi:putative addiction module antidote